MTKITFLSTVLLLLLTSPAALAEKIRYDLIGDQSTVEFRVNSTLSEIRGISQKAKSSILFDPETGLITLPIQAETPVESFKTGLWLRDRELHKMFESGKFPRMSAVIDRVICSPFGDGVVTDCKIHTRLTIRDIEEPFEIGVKLVVEGDRLTISGRFELTTDQYRLKPPSFFGLFRADKNVRIEFETLWRQEPYITGTES